MVKEKSEHFSTLILASVKKEENEGNAQYCGCVVDILCVT